jgi:hypothetical protein
MNANSARSLARLLFSFTLIFAGGAASDIGEVSVSPSLFACVFACRPLPKSRKKSAFYGIINLFGQINKNLNIKCYHMFSPIPRLALRAKKESTAQHGDQRRFCAMTIYSSMQL